jgi:hypothetical protein
MRSVLTPELGILPFWPDAGGNEGGVGGMQLAVLVTLRVRHLLLCMFA